MLNLKNTAVLFLLIFMQNPAEANEVNILTANFKPSGDNSWSVKVTLKHADSGWDHYADKWQVVDANDKVLAERILMHPHVGEQPFTRGLGGVTIAAEISTVYIRAHDKVHGWAEQRFKVDLHSLRD